SLSWIPPFATSREARSGRAPHFDRARRHQIARAASEHKKAMTPTAGTSKACRRERQRSVWRGRRLEAGGQGQAYEFGERSGSRLLHDAAAVIFGRARADP